MKRTACIALLMLLSLGIKAQARVFYPMSDSLLYKATLSLISHDLGLDSTNARIFVSPNFYNLEDAFVIQMSDNEFSVNVQDALKKEKILMFMHECVHVSQVYQKRLYLRNVHVWFEGKVYTKTNSAKEDRPFETEAEKISNTLYKKYSKQILSTL